MLLRPAAGADRPGVDVGRDGLLGEVLLQIGRQRPHRFITIGSGFVRIAFRQIASRALSRPGADLPRWREIPGLDPPDQRPHVNASSSPATGACPVIKQ